MDSLTTGLRPVLLLTVLSALLFLPGLASIPPTDRDEARFMQATKQMLETGDLVSIRFQDELRTKKPVGIHWLQYLSVKLGANQDMLAVWAYRLPSALAAWLTTLGVFFVGRRHFNARTGLIAATLTASTLILIIEAHLAKTDAVLLLCIFVAQAALLEFYIGDPKQRPPTTIALLFWAALGLGLLIKGPVIAAILIATVLVLGIADRNLQWLRGLRPALGLPVALAFVAPWVMALTASGNAAVLTTSLTEDFLPKLVRGAEGHGALPGTHLLLSPITLWPASLVFIPGLVLAWQRRDKRVLRYTLAWAGATWLMFELVPTKLPHYVLPTVPALALATAGFAAEAWSSPRAALALWNTRLWLLVATILAVGIIWATQAYGGTLVMAGLFAVGLLMTGLLLTSGKVPAFMAAPLAASVTSLLVFAGVLPRLSDFALSERLAASVASHASTDAPRVALSRYHEPSAVFLLGTETWLTNARNAASHIAADRATLAAVAPDQLDLVKQLIQDQGQTASVLDRIAGYNYSKGRPETLILMRSEPADVAP